MKKVLNLEEFAGGALAEQLNSELNKVLDNIYDPNTEATKARKLALTITLKPDSSREVVGVNIQTKATLVPAAALETRLWLDKDLKTGEMNAVELRKQMPGQVELDTKEVEQEAIARNSANVIDLKAAKSN